MNSEQKKKLMIGIPYVIFGYLVDKISWLYRHVPGDMAAKKLGNTLLYFEQAFQNPLPSFHPLDLLSGLVGAAVLCGIVQYRRANAKKISPGSRVWICPMGNCPGH